MTSTFTQIASSAARWHPECTKEAGVNDAHQLQSIRGHGLRLGTVQRAGPGDAAARGARAPLSPHALQTLPAQPFLTILSSHFKYSLSLL